MSNFLNSANATRPPTASFAWVESRRGREPHYDGRAYWAQMLEAGINDASPRLIASLGPPQRAKPRIRGQIRESPGSFRHRGHYLHREPKVRVSVIWLLR